MKVEKLDVVAINVKDLDQAIWLFSDLLDTTFVKLTNVEIRKTATKDADSTAESAKVMIAMDRKGYLELVQTDPPVAQEGLRNIHFKVPEMEKAKAEMKKKGVRLIAEIRIGGLKEAIFNPPDIHGVRFCLVEYNASSLLDACLQPIK